MERTPLGLRAQRVALRSPAVQADASLFATVYEEHHQDLFRYIRSIVRDPGEAEDVLQSVMLKALAALQSEQRDFELRPWLFRIAHNEAINRVRQRRPTVELDAAHATTAASPCEVISDRERLQQLWADLAQLPERQRQALVLRELSGLSHEEIAAVIGTSGRAVKQTIFEARVALGELAEGRGMDCAEIRRVLSDGDGRVRRRRRMRAHLASCDGCRAFDLALTQRPDDLRALAPALPVASATALLGHLLHGTAAVKAGTRPLPAARVPRARQPAERPRRWAAARSAWRSRPRSRSSQRRSSRPRGPRASRRTTPPGPSGSRDTSRVVAPGHALRHDARAHRNAIGRDDGPKASGKHAPAGVATRARPR